MAERTVLRIPAPAWAVDRQLTSGTRPRRCPASKTGFRRRSPRPSRRDVAAVAPGHVSISNDRAGHAPGCGVAAARFGRKCLYVAMCGPARCLGRCHDRSPADRLHDSARSSRRSQPASAPGRGESRVLRATEADTVPISARAALHIGEAASPRCFLDIASECAAPPQGLGLRSRRGSLTERVAPTSLGIRCNLHPSLRVNLRGHPDCAKTTDEEPADNNNCGPDNIRIRHCVLRTSCSTRSTTLAHDRLCMRMRPRRWARHRWLGG